MIGKLRLKLLLLIFSIIVINTLAIWAIGNNYIENYYRYKKNQELVTTAKEIIRISAESPTERRPWFSYVLTREENNMRFLIFDYTELIPSIIYSSKNDSDTITGNASLWINNAISNGVFRSLALFPERLFSLIIDNTMYLYALIGENQYLFIAVSMDYLTQTAQITIEFFSYISLISIFLVLIPIFMIASTITKPIIKITNVTKKISKMQFDEKCKIKGNDELSQLAKNVNMMSKQIERNLNLLIEKNEILKKDLDRQEENEQLRRQFVANVSHDFKTPLALIQAYTEILKEGKLESEDLETYNIILDQVNKMNLLVTQLLSLSQLESGLIKLEMSFFPIDDVILSVLKNLQVLINERNITYHYIKDDDYIVKGDYQQILQVVTNLVENAIKYTPDNTEFNIKISYNYSRVKIEISNNSPQDLTQDQISHLFDSFYKLDRTRSASLKSYGLGLAIVKAIVELHEQNCGATLEDGIITFFFTLDIYNITENDDNKHEIELN